MTVVAIRCEACQGTGVGEGELLEWPKPFGGTVWLPDPIECPLCSGTGMETPPNTDPDKRAQAAIEGEPQ